MLSAPPDQHSQLVNGSAAAPCSWRGEGRLPRHAAFVTLTADFEPTPVLPVVPAAGDKLAVSSACARF
jgi:hypothetical protein